MVSRVRDECQTERWNSRDIIDREDEQGEPGMIDGANFFCLGRDRVGRVSFLMTVTSVKLVFLIERVDFDESGTT